MWFDKHNQATHQHKAQNYLAKISLRWLILPYNQRQQLIRLGTLNTITFKRAIKCVNWGCIFSSNISWTQNSTFWLLHQYNSI